MTKLPEKAAGKRTKHVYLRDRMDRYDAVLDVMMGWPLAIIQWTRDILWMLTRVLKKLVD